MIVDLKLRKVCLLALCALFSLELLAQEEEYRMEIGGALGMDFYLGDVNSIPFRYPGLMSSLLVRRNFNPRMGLKANLALCYLRGSSAKRFIPQDVSSLSPEGGIAGFVRFQRTVLDFGVQYELNLLGYGLGYAYQEVHRLTPYLTFGLGGTLAMGYNGGTAFGMNIPIGAGVKYKVAPRMNAGIEWTFRFTTTDALDENGTQPTLVHPFNIPSKGFKNKDAYSFFMLFLTYDISPKCKECHNNN